MSQYINASHFPQLRGMYHTVWGISPSYIPVPKQ